MAEALASSQTSAPSVAISDDLDFVRELRQRCTERHVHIIAVTSRTDAEDVTAFSAGADDCIGHTASREYVLARLAAARRIADVEASLRAAVVQNRKLSTIDELTRVASRRFFARHFPYEVERAARFGRGLSVIMCDIDFFKKVNDTYGHAGGDEVLREFSARITSSLRRGFDWVARLGGEEFAVILPETSAQDGLTVARQLRRKIGNTPFTIGGKEVPITASFGLCGLDLVPRGRRNIAERILGVADTALYNSKRAGRNRVTATRLRPRASDAPIEKAG
jgi:two-component system cell cycle response regulator